MVEARDGVSVLRPAIRLALASSLALAVFVAAPDASDAAVRTRVGLCTIEAPDGHAAAVNALAAEAPRIQATVEAELGIRPVSSFRVVLVTPGGRLDPDIARLDGSVPTWAAGYMVGERRLVVIRTAEASRYPYGTIASVFAHEVTHLMLHDALGGRLPLWCNEGLATWEGRRWSVVDALVVSGALLTQDLPALDSLSRAFHGTSEDARLAYAASLAFTASSVRRHGDGFPARLIAEARVRPFDEAWRVASGEPLAAAEARWRRGALLRYRWVPLVLSASTLWLAISLLALAAIARRRREAARVRETLPDYPLPGEGDVWPPDDEPTGERPSADAPRAAENPTGRDSGREVG